MNLKVMKRAAQKDKNLAGAALSILHSEKMHFFKYRELAIFKKGKCAPRNLPCIMSRERVDLPVLNDPLLFLFI